MPRLRAHGLAVRLTLVGRAPTLTMRAAAAQDPDVCVTGGVPSVLPYFAAPCIVALPIRSGSGTRLKILEAFAAGAAVVSSAKGAEGITVRDGQDIRLAKTADDFAAVIALLWQDDAARRRQTAAALALLEKSYSWPAAARAIRASLPASLLDGDGGR
jgi:glycosyltransferase involved in cell wall biosynthesis